MFTNAKIVAVGVDSCGGYHEREAKRGSVEYIVSSSTLKEFDKCPARWVAGYEPPPSDAKDTGNLLDCLLLTPEHFNERYAIAPATYTNDKGEEKKWNANANACKEWTADRGEKEIIKQADFEEALNAIKVLRADPVIAEFLDSSDRQVHVAGEWTDGEMIIPVQCLIDLAPRWESAFANCLGDLKTSRNASVPVWERWCFDASYHAQAAFNLDLYNAAAGEKRSQFCFVVQENYKPWQPGKRMLSPEFLELGRTDYQRRLKNYAYCVKSGFWPGYDDNQDSVNGWSVLNVKPWMEQRSFFAPTLANASTEMPF